MDPDQQRQYREKRERFKSLPPDEKEKIKNRLKGLMELTHKERLERRMKLRRDLEEKGVVKPRGKRGRRDKDGDENGPGTGRWQNRR